ncbi:hypothetical protein [Sporosarcina sp. NPDC096371]|uniref:hypothetical protein n=1 Tax=Sporosarcina sp. NPDC096371 TaxID=3364530 RepID=UPI0038169B68
MEELTLYVPGLEAHFYKGKELQYNITQLSSSVPNSSSNVTYIKEGRKLYLSSVAFGTLEFQAMLFDFERNRITFKRKKELSKDIHDGIYEILTALKLDFQPIQQLFVTSRPFKQT